MPPVCSSVWIRASGLVFDECKFLGKKLIYLNQHVKDGDELHEKREQLEPSCQFRHVQGRSVHCRLGDYAQ